MKTVFFFILIVFVNEEYNTLADRAFKVAQDYVKRNSNLGLAIESVDVVGNRSDAKTLLEECKCFLIYSNSLLL